MDSNEQNAHIPFKLDLGGVMRLSYFFSPGGCPRKVGDRRPSLLL
jgi:hypothetical protein